jgi:DNA replication protein DnaC
MIALRLRPLAMSIRGEMSNVYKKTVRSLWRGLLYHRASQLFAMLTLGTSDGRYPRMLRALSRADLLIIHDWGPQTLSADRRLDLLGIVEDRYDRGSILITSQIPVDRWYEIIGNPTLADAILDRVVHNAYRIDLTGESLRKRRASILDA